MSTDNKWWYYCIADVAQLSICYTGAIWRRPVHCSPAVCLCCCHWRCSPSSVWLPTCHWLCSLSPSASVSTRWQWVPFKRAEMNIHSSNNLSDCELIFRGHLLAILMVYVFKNAHLTTPNDHCGVNCLLLAPSTLYGANNLSVSKRHKATTQTKKQTNKLDIKCISNVVCNTL